MRSSTCRLAIRLLLASILFATLAVYPGLAQAPETSPAIDMMIVIDDSCSMFPRHLIVPGCGIWGSDPDFLRIKGASLFIARLGFGQSNEQDYQLGVVSLGDDPILISPLTPLRDARDDLARQIANPSPALATRFIPALNMAYEQLKESPERRPDNQPAVVLITDGHPFPREGQSNTDIENLVSQHQDIPLFILLLQDPGEFPDRFEEYVRFWQQMQARYSHIFAYYIEDAEQIEKTYNDIVAQLHQTVPGEAVTVAPEVPLRVFVSQYIKKLVVTAIHPTDRPSGLLLIEDPEGRIVLFDEPGVEHFRGENNPAEVISISDERLSQSLKETYWTIKTNQQVSIFIDREGAYRINILEPEVYLPDITNVYQARERQNQNIGMTMKFNLVLEDEQPVLDAQPIWGEVIYPDGSEHALPIPQFLRPDISGTYEFSFDFIQAYPDIIDAPGNFSFVLFAGNADPRSPERIPIATGRVIVEAGPGPYLESTSVTKIVCSPGQPSQFVVNIGDFETVQPETASVVVSGEHGEVTLDPVAPGVFSGNLESLCAPDIARLACSSQTVAEFKMRFQAQMREEAVSPVIERGFPVEIFAPVCTPTPVPVLPTLSPTSTPAPTPVLDSDGDGLDDLVDKCPDEPGLPMFDGCPPPGWLRTLADGLGIAVLAAAVIYGLPLLRVLTIAKPPHAYVMACRRGKVILPPTAVHEVGIRRRANRVKIGGDKKKSHIYVEGLRSVEFIVSRQEDKVVLLDSKSGSYKGTFRMLSPEEITAINSEITLYLGLNVKILERQKCPGQQATPEASRLREAAR